MTNALWIAVAVAVGVLGFVMRWSVRRQLGRWALARLVGELFAWYGYIGGIAIVAVQTNGGWSVGRSGVPFRSTWPEEGPIYLVVATLGAVGFFLYGERRGVDWLGDVSDPFPATYVAVVLDGEASSSKEECRRMARRLKRIARKSRQPLPPGLVEFVDRHLDRTA